MNENESGVTFLEVIVAAFLISLAIIPLMQLLPRSLDATVSSYEVVLSAAATRRTEQIIALLRTSTSVGNGSMTCTDLPNCLITWTTTVELSNPDPSIGSLTRVRVTACQDVNQNNVCDPGERQVRYDTKVTTRP